MCESDFTCWQPLPDFEVVNILYGLYSARMQPHLSMQWTDPWPAVVYVLPNPEATSISESQIADSDSSNKYKQLTLEEPESNSKNTMVILHFTFKL